MYEDSGCLDPNAMMAQGTAAGASVALESDPPPQAVMTPTAIETHHNSLAENVGLSMEILSYPYSCGEGEDAMVATTAITSRVAASAATAMEIIEHPQQMGFDMLENPYNHSNNLTTLLVEEVNNNDGSGQYLSFDQSNLDTCVPELQRVYNSHHHLNRRDRHFPDPMPTPTPTPAPDLLNLVHLTRSPASSFGNSSVSFENPTHNTTANLPKRSDHGTWVGNCPVGADSTNVSSVSYDQLLHLNLPAPPPNPLKELFQSLPHGYTVPASRNGFVFGGGDDMEASRAAYQDGDGRDFDNGVLFIQDVGYVGKKRGGKRAKQFTCTTERQRRVDLGSKFDTLKQLIPNHSKNDRASVVGDAIDYIRELLRTVNELKLLVEKKRYEKQRIKRHKVEEGATEGDDLEQVAIGDPDDHSYSESLRSSWIQRKSKDTEVDVRIIDNEVTIKLVQRKKVNCLVYASQALDELKLDLQHVAGGHIGDFCSFIFNSKISESSAVYASAVANKLIEVIDNSLAAA